MDDHDIRRLVEHVLDLKNYEIERSGTGASSMAWKVNGNGAAFVLRMMRPAANRPVTYQSEFAILRTLHADGFRVPEPITNSFEQPYNAGESLPPWAITRVIPGQPILKAKLNSVAAAQLGQFLTDLHALPVRAYGRLIEHNAPLHGQQSTPLAGICARWCWAQLWPFDQSKLFEHPISQLMPELLPRLSACESLLWNIATDEQVVLNHSDLYGEHIFLHDDDLSGIIDFGAAFIAVPAWEFAVLAHYHGWNAVEAILAAYQPATPDLLDQSHHLALVVALYKLQKAVKAEVPAPKIQRIMAFVRETLACI